MNWKEAIIYTIILFAIVFLIFVYVSPIVGAFILIIMEIYVWGKWIYDKVKKKERRNDIQEDNRQIILSILGIKNQIDFCSRKR